MSPVNVNRSRIHFKVRIHKRVSRIGNYGNAGHRAHKRVIRKGIDCDARALTHSHSLHRRLMDIDLRGHLAKIRNCKNGLAFAYSGAFLDRLLITASPAARVLIRRTINYKPWSLRTNCGELDLLIHIGKLHLLEVELALCRTEARLFLCLFGNIFFHLPLIAHHRIFEVGEFLLCLFWKRILDIELELRLFLLHFVIRFIEVQFLCLKLGGCYKTTLFQPSLTCDSVLGKQQFFLRNLKLILQRSQLLLGLPIFQQFEISIIAKIELVADNHITFVHQKIGGGAQFGCRRIGGEHQ